MESKFWRFEALLTRLSLVQWDGTDQGNSSVLQRKKNKYKHRIIKKACYGRDFNWLRPPPFKEAPEANH